MQNRRHISVAPDTHVIQASVRLGLMGQNEAQSGGAREKAEALWRMLLQNEPLCPIDVHTPLWLWSRGGFKEEI